MKKYEYLIVLLVIAVTAACTLWVKGPVMSYEDHAALMKALNEYEMQVDGSRYDKYICYSNGTVYHKEDHGGVMTYYLDHETTDFYDYDGNGIIEDYGGANTSCRVDLDKETQVIVSYVMTNNEASDLDKVFSAKALKRYKKHRRITSQYVYNRWEKEQWEKVLKALENERYSEEVERAIERIGHESAQLF